MISTGLTPQGLLYNPYSVILTCRFCTGADVLRKPVQQFSATKFSEHRVSINPLLFSLYPLRPPGRPCITVASYLSWCCMFLLVYVWAVWIFITPLSVIRHVLLFIHYLFCLCFSFRAAMMFFSLRLDFSFYALLGFTYRIRASQVAKSQAGWMSDNTIKVLTAYGVCYTLC